MLSTLRFSFRTTMVPLACWAAGLAVAPPPLVAAEASSLADYEFVAPAHWQEHRAPEQIILTQSPEPMACRIQILPLQPTSGDLESDVKTVFNLMYPGFAYSRSGAQQYTLSRGFLPKGLEYCMMEAAMSLTTPDGGHHAEDGAALVIRAGERIAIIAARHGGLLAHTDCLNRYETWRRFFNSFTVKSAPLPERAEPDPGPRIVGAWSQSGGGALSEYVFAANGRYAFSGAVGSSYTTSDLNYEYLHIKTYAFDGDGAFSITDDTLTLRKADGEPEQARFRFEQVNHGGMGWKDRLWLLKQDRLGQVELLYERRDP